MNGVSFNFWGLKVELLKLLMNVLQILKTKRIKKGVSLPFDEVEEGLPCVFIPFFLLFLLFTECHFLFSR